MLWAIKSFKILDWAHSKNICRKIYINYLVQLNMRVICTVVRAAPSVFSDTFFMITAGYKKADTVILFLR